MSQGARVYDPAFLAPAGVTASVRKALTVKLPELPDFLLADAARLIGQPNEFELRYSILRS